jgi:HD-like signal output (HDOD) protein
MHYEEVRIAALLHDIAEILMWWCAPQDMLEIQSIQEEDRTLRSRHVQERVLGFQLFHLQRELAQQWGLPHLLLTLMNDSVADHPRVHNVVLAANLARHSAKGWNDEALPDDYKEISELLHIPVEEVITMIGVDGGGDKKSENPRG